MEVNSHRVFLKNFISIVLGASLLLCSIQVFAVGTGARDIISLGCHTYDNACYVGFSGPAAGQPGCTGNEFRWDIDAKNGKLAYASFLAAMHSGRQVSFEIGAGCFALMPAWPSFSWYRVFD